MKDQITKRIVERIPAYQKAWIETEVIKADGTTGREYLIVHFWGIDAEGFVWPYYNNGEWVEIWDNLNTFIVDCLPVEAGQ